MASSSAIAQNSGALGGARPTGQAPLWRDYGFVVESVNVSVLLYVPVRSASLAPIA